MGDPKVRPWAKYYAEQLSAELLPRLSPEQIQAAYAYVQDREFEWIVAGILKSIDGGEGY